MEDEKMCDLKWPLGATSYISRNLGTWVILLDALLCIPEFATIIKQEVGGKSKIEYLPAVEDDPQRRRPDISVAKSVLGWEPRVKLMQG